MKLAGRIYYGPEATHFSSLVTDGDFAPEDTLLVFEEGGTITVGGDLVLSGNIARLYGIVDRGHSPRIQIGGDLILNGASLRVEDGGTMTVGGSIVHQDGKNGMNYAELYGGGGYVSIWYNTMSDDVAEWTVTADGGIRTGTTERTSQWGGDGKTYWRQWHKGLTLLVR